jgi:hypothetical protein
MQQLQLFIYAAIDSSVKVWVRYAGYTIIDSNENGGVLNLRYKSNIKTFSEIQKCYVLELSQVNDILTGKRYERPVYKKSYTPIL